MRIDKIPRRSFEGVRFTITNTDSVQGSLAWARVRGSGWAPHCIIDLNGEITQIIPWNHTPKTDEDDWVVAFVNLGEFEKYEDETMRSKFGGIPWEPDQHGPMLQSKHCPLTKEQILTAMYMMAAVKWESGTIDVKTDCPEVFDSIIKQFLRT